MPTHAKAGWSLRHPMLKFQYLVIFEAKDFGSYGFNNRYGIHK